jgi:MFS family permease
MFEPSSIWDARQLALMLTYWKYCAGLIGCSQATSFSNLMAARVVHAFGSGVCEALPVQLVNDIFFLHERGKRIGYYTGTWYPVPLPLILADSCSRTLLRRNRPSFRWIHAERRAILASVLLR